MKPVNGADRWKFAVDRGGTFTDIVGIDPQGSVHTVKLLSVSERYDDAGIAGIRQLLGLDSYSASSLESGHIDSIRIGTTVATNALLERKGVPVALCTTAGFEDLPTIGNGTRKDLFKLDTRNRIPLCSLSTGIDEETGADGRIIRPLDADHALYVLLGIRGKGFEHLAIALKNSWINPQHETILARIAREKAGFRSVIASHEVMPLIGLFRRTGTTLLETFLSPVLFMWAESVARLAGNTPLEFMQSSGGLCGIRSLKAKDTILSGPAGGVAGVAAIAGTLGIRQAIGFDMGGTSTDVSRFDGQSGHVFEATVDDVSFHADMLDVETVAAGGGSLLSFDGERLRVGPGSAGSSPGPACYGLGGPLAVTDANLLLGRIVPEFMPRTFGKNSDDLPDREAARASFEELLYEVNRSSGNAFSMESLAAGFLRIANEIMCRAMKKISVSRGYDIRNHALICFGGAAAQHACDIAEILGIETVVVPKHAGVLSAWGIAFADRLERRTGAIMKLLSDELLSTGLSATAVRLARELTGNPGESPGGNNVRTTVFLDLRPLGTDSWLSLRASEHPGDMVRFDSAAAISERFETEFGLRFGFKPEAVPIEVVNVRVEVRHRSEEFRTSPLPLNRRMLEPREAPMQREVWTGSAMEPVPVFDRSRLLAGETLSGPAMVAGEQLTLYVAKGFEAMVDGYGNILVKNLHAGERRMTTTESWKRGPDPMLLEVFNNIFMNVAEQMGQTLCNTAYSVNMKERLDFSCAIFDRDGRLVSNAPHIPVHLGAMEATVQQLIESQRQAMLPGEMYLANNPHRGGSHLPDMTVVMPLFVDGKRPSFYVANRGHHADIGGTTPGSMPPSSRTIFEEGVVIDGFRLVKDGLFMREDLLELLSSVPWPARNLPERISDLQAQIAANRKGCTELRQIVEEYGLPVVERYMQYIRDNARHAMSRVLKTLAGSDGHASYRFGDRMDNGTPVCVAIRINAPQNEEPSAVIDFTGTGSADPGNSNTPAAVARAAVLYVFRSLIEQEIPLNSGCLDRIRIVIPEGCLLNPPPNSAVAVGNVETSQRIVDVLLGALGKAAASQGTMNNLLFGRPDNSGMQYYETIPGGCGAIEGHDGASGMQVHMTNTRVTDPEILEHRFPDVRVTRFSLRRGSGGAGKWNGGDGVERALTFSEPMRLTMISERRETAPFGIDGGGSGASGENILIAADGTHQVLEGRIDRIVNPGETILVKTPGGGGFGYLPQQQ